MKLCEDVYFKAHICAVRSFQGIYLFMPHMLFYLACNFLNAAETAKCHSLQLFARLYAKMIKNCANFPMVPISGTELKLWLSQID